MNVYFFSGLGADHRAFAKTQVPEGFPIIHVPWIREKSRNESLRDYCLRISEYIDQSEAYMLLGLSFGGIVVCELTRILSPKKAVIISSAKNYHEIPWYYRMMKVMGIIRLIPGSLLKWPNRITYRAFGVETPEEKKLLSDILRESDAAYLKWAVNQILNWKGKGDAQIIHIHGSSDRILPLRYVKADVIIKGGRHFMVLSKAEEVNQVLAEILKLNRHENRI